MSHLNAHRIAHRVALSLVGLAFLSPILAAQSAKVEGLIKARDGDTMIIRTSNSPDLTVLLTDKLAIKVEGTYNEQNQLVAKSVAFRGICPCWTRILVTASARSSLNCWFSVMLPTELA